MVARLHRKWSLINLRYLKKHNQTTSNNWTTNSTSDCWCQALSLPWTSFIFEAWSDNCDGDSPENFVTNLLTESKRPKISLFQRDAEHVFLASHQASCLHDFWSVCWMNFATQIPSFWTLALCCHAGPMAFGKLQCIGSCQHLKIQGMSTGFQCQCGRWRPGRWSRHENL